MTDTNSDDTMSDDEASPKKRRDLLTRRPSYRKILSDLGGAEIGMFLVVRFSFVLPKSHQPPPPSLEALNFVRKKNKRTIHPSIFIHQVSSRHPRFPSFQIFFFFWFIFNCPFECMLSKWFLAVVGSVEVLLSSFQNS